MDLCMSMFVLVGSSEASRGQTQHHRQGEKMHCGDDVGDPRIRDGTIERYSNRKGRYVQRWAERTVGVVVWKGVAMNANEGMDRNDCW